MILHNYTRLRSSSKYPNFISRRFDNKIIMKIQVVSNCPYCNSANVTKISTASKVVDTAVWGIFGTKRFKQWHCNSCSSDF